MFSLKLRALRAAVVAVLVGVGGSALAQNPSPRPVQNALNEGPVWDAPAVTASGEQYFPVPGAPRTSAPAYGALAGASCESCFDWKKVPRVRPAPKAGYFPVAPTGPGYYSALDQWRGDFREAPPKYPYPRTSAIQPPFYDADNFSYLDNPDNDEFDFFDPLKRIRLGDNWLFTTGGEFRYRYMNETHARLGPRSNVYDLTRARVYTDLWYRDDLRIFAEYYGAWSANQDLLPAPNDQQKAGIMNLFADVKLADLGGNPAYLRVGRQELLFGSQRLISTLDWANTRRSTFQGARVFRQTEKWDFDAFWVQPVIPNANRPVLGAERAANSFNSVDNNMNFAGAWATYRPKAGQSIDAYYLMLDNTNTFSQLGIPRGNFTRHTVGGRYSGNQGNVLFDSETAFQFGSQNGRDVFAAMTTQGLGYNFKDTLWSPTIWAYYDYASGGNPITGTAHTFNQLFGFGHQYMGWVDQVARQNIHDLNFHLHVYPTKWMNAWVQFHSFWLADSRDALYNAGGNAIRFSPTGRAGSHVGEELDLVFNFHLSKHADILAGYSYLWGGEFLRNTAGRFGSINTGLTYVQLSYKW